MKSTLVLSLLGAAAPLFAAPTASSPLVRRASDPEQAVPNSFIVVLKPDTPAVDVAAHHAHVRRMVLAKRDGSSGSSSGGIDRVFRIGSEFSAYVGGFDDATAEEIARLPGVASVEQDFVIRLEPTSPDAAAPAVIWARAAAQTQKDAPWHLGDVSHRDRGAKDYVFDEAAGNGSSVYVVDSGIRASHAEFGGRVRFGINGLTGSTTAPANSDGDGHGTHCAGLAAGANYGVAKKVGVVDVKTFGDDGTVSHVFLSQLGGVLAETFVC